VPRVSVFPCITFTEDEKYWLIAATWNEIKPLEQYLLKKDEEKHFSRNTPIELALNRRR
jgi:hypothetical protein